MNLNTVSKIGLIVIAAGLSWIIGSEGADWPGTLPVAGGVALAFGPDLAATIGSRRRGRRWLAERVEGGRQASCTSRTSTTCSFA
jgi:hypothetical protein